MEPQNAYKSVLFAMRNTGDIDKPGRETLSCLRHTLRIPLSRHKDEVRTIVEDIKQNDDAERYPGWICENERLIPVFPMSSTYTRQSLWAENAVTIKDEKKNMEETCNSPIRQGKRSFEETDLGESVDSGISVNKKPRYLSHKCDTIEPLSGDEGNNVQDEKPFIKVEIEALVDIDPQTHGVKANTNYNADTHLPMTLIHKANIKREVDGVSTCCFQSKRDTYSMFKEDAAIHKHWPESCKVALTEIQDSAITSHDSKSDFRTSTLHERDYTQQDDSIDQGSDEILSLEVNQNTDEMPSLREDKQVSKQHAENDVSIRPLSPAKPEAQMNNIAEPDPHLVTIQSVHCQTPTTDSTVNTEITTTSEDSKEEVLTAKKLVAIADAIGANWQLLAPSLELSQPDIDKIQLDHRKTAEQIYQMFLKWKEKQHMKATKTNLLKILRDSNMVTVDWKKVYKV